MRLEIKTSEFDKAIALIEDLVFKNELNSSDHEDIKLLKLLQAREGNPKFEYDLAEMICGEDGNSFPYRSSYYLTAFFKNLGFRYEHSNQTRRFWVEDVLKQLNIKDIAKIIRQGLFNKRDFRNDAKKNGTDFNTVYNAALQEFKDFILDCTSDNQELDLAFLLNMNVNTDLLFNPEPKTSDSALNDLIRESKNRFLNPTDRLIALEKIWDAFERLKTYYDNDKKKSIQLIISKVATEIDPSELENEFDVLTKIGNAYRIRHHEKGKKDITEKSQVEYLYFRVLNLIDLCCNKIGQLEE